MAEGSAHDPAQLCDPGFFPRRRSARRGFCRSRWALAGAGGAARRATAATVADRGPQTGRVIRGA